MVKYLLNSTEAFGCPILSTKGKGKDTLSRTGAQGPLALNHTDLMQEIVLLKPYFSRRDPV